MPLTPNDFAMQSYQGKVDLGPLTNVITCRVSANETATLVAGQTVKLEDSAGGVPNVLARTADTDAVFGVIVYNHKDSGYVAKDMVEVAIVGTVMYMTAAAAIARGVAVHGVVATKKVATATGAYPEVGIALDKAAADGDLVRVYITAPRALITGLTLTGALSVGTTLGVTGNSTLGGTLAVTGAATLASTLSATAITNSLGLIGPDTSYGVHAKRVRLTTAQMNAGASLVAAVAGKKLRMIDAKVIAIGGNAAATANATGVAISATQGTSAVKLFEVNLAQLTRSAVNRVGTASTKVLADGASFVANDAASAITVKAEGGTDLITATHFDVELTYAIEA